MRDAGRTREAPGEPLGDQCRTVTADLPYPGGLISGTRGGTSAGSDTQAYRFSQHQEDPLADEEKQIRKLHKEIEDLRKLAKDIEKKVRNIEIAVYRIDDKLSKT